MFPKIRSLVTFPNRDTMGSMNRRHQLSSFPALFRRSMSFIRGGSGRSFLTSTENGFATKEPEFKEWCEKIARWIRKSYRDPRRPFRRPKCPKIRRAWWNTRRNVMSSPLPATYERLRLSQFRHHTHRHSRQCRGESCDVGEPAAVATVSKLFADR